MEVANLVISILSLVATIAISFVIYFLEKKNQENARKNEIKENAKRFIIDNADEIDYLPWATIASSAKQVHEIAESMEKAKKAKKLEEQNSPTNQNLGKIIEQNDLKIKQSEEQIKLLEEQNDNLNEQLERAIRNEEDAKKEAKISRIWVYISTGIAFASLVATILIAIFK